MRHIVFFDFDNTITRYDVFDDMLDRFAADESWVALEKQWKAGKIGSRECLHGQMGCIRVPRKRLDRYLTGVKIDPYFKPLLSFLRAKKIKTYILSDNFDYILRGVLRAHGVTGSHIFANRLTMHADRLIPQFPHANKACSSCAHCKTRNMRALAGKGATVVYVGDGRSDTCPSEHADVVFAKDYLKEHCRKKAVPCIPFAGLKDVYGYFKDIYNS